DAQNAQVAAAPRRVFVPQAALVNTGGRSSVWVIENGMARQHTADVGPARGDRVEVRQGLLGGESLVLTPPAGLKDGSKVKLAAH
ncbi:MAG TPA: efflux RND transporter periplasmic adaptor subunit, partial [Verrucomicrobiae bacterium]|nr:efflux RND transporter periplasmic adaptor subunit [Verrucomicrobiae bacterium]